MTISDRILSLRSYSKFKNAMIPIGKISEFLRVEYKSVNMKVRKLEAKVESMKKEQEMINKRMIMMMVLNVCIMLFLMNYEDVKEYVGERFNYMVENVMVTVKEIKNDEEVKMVMKVLEDFFVENVVSFTEMFATKETSVGT